MTNQQREEQINMIWEYIKKEVEAKDIKALYHWVAILNWEVNARG